MKTVLEKIQLKINQRVIFANILRVSFPPIFFRKKHNTQKFLEDTKGEGNNGAPPHHPGL